MCHIAGGLARVPAVCRAGIPGILSVPKATRGVGRRIWNTRCSDLTPEVSRGHGGHARRAPRDPRGPEARGPTRGVESGLHRACLPGEGGRGKLACLSRTPTEAPPHVDPDDMQDRGRSVCMLESPSVPARRMLEGVGSGPSPGADQTGAQSAPAWPTHRLATRSAVPRNPGP